MRATSVIRTISGCLPRGADLLEDLTRFVSAKNIRYGRIQGIGATTHAAVAYYDQERKEYLPIVFPGGMEILNLQGNISMRDGEPILHLHVILGDRKGAAFGGHVLPGTKVWALEVFIDELAGEPPVRKPDEGTGLNLWQGDLLA